MSADPQHKKQPRGLMESLVALRQRLQGGQLTERRFALSVAVGLFIGCSPFFGFHAVIALGLAFVLRLDVLIAYLATNISVPPLIPFLLFAELQVGSFLMNGHFHSLALSDFAPEQALGLGGAVFVGFPIVGAVVAILGGAIAYVIGARVFAVRRAAASAPSAPSDKEG